MTDEDSVLFDPNTPTGQQDSSNWQRLQEKQKSLHLRKIAKPCSGLAERGKAGKAPVAAKRKSSLLTVRTECHPSSPLPGDRWYGCSSRMTFPPLEETSPPTTSRAVTEVTTEEEEEDTPVTSEGSEGEEDDTSEQQSEEDGKSAVVAALLSGGDVRGGEDKSTDCEDEEEEEEQLEEEEDPDVDLEEKTEQCMALIENAGHPDVDDDDDGDKSPGSSAGVARGAALGFGVGVSVALPFWYFLANSDSLCTHSSWRYRY